MLRIGKFIETESRMVASRDWNGGGRRMRSYCLMGTEFVWDDFLNSGNG